MRKEVFHMEHRLLKMRLRAARFEYRVARIGYWVGIFSTITMVLF